MHLKSIVPIVFVLLFTTSQTNAQSHYFGSWNVGNAEYFFDKKISAWTEAQLRSQQFYNDFFYHEIKCGIKYQINKSLGVLIGTGQYATYSNGSNFKTPVIHEFRLWEQFTLINNIERLKLEHRYRIEQRWRNDEYRNRFRYRINPIFPINKSKVENHTLFATIYDEIFLTNKDTYFERNRFFAGVGYQCSTRLSVQAGWLRQFDYSATASTTKDFLQTTIFIRFHNNNGPLETHPSSMD